MKRLFFFNKKHKKKIFLAIQEGSTLMETLIYIAIIGIVITSIVAYSMSLFADRNKNYVVQNVQANSRVILNILNNKIRSASAVITPVPGSSSNQLILDIPGEASSTVFSLVGNRLAMSKDGEANIYLSDKQVKVSDLIFSNDSKNGQRAIIGIQAKISYKTSSNNLENSYTQNIKSVVTVRK